MVLLYTAYMTGFNLWFYDHMPRAGSLLVLHLAVLALTLGLPRRGAEWESRRYGEPRWFQYWSAEDLDAALEAEGFAVLEAWTSTTPQAEWLVRQAGVAGRGSQEEARR